MILHKRLHYLFKRSDKPGQKMIFELIGELKLGSIYSVGIFMFLWPFFIGLCNIDMDAIERCLQYLKDKNDK